MGDAPKVFISYSWESVEHNEWVKKLAYNLTVHGVKVLLDQLDLRSGDDLNDFMDEGLTSSKFVLCICSELYLEKARGKIGGVGHEITLIEDLIEENKKDIQFICIVRNKLQTKVPDVLESKLYLDFSKDDDYPDRYKELVQRIFDEDLAKKPNIGKNPYNSEMAQSILVNINFDSLKYSNASLSDTVTFDYSNNDGKYSIGSGKYEFRTSWTTAGTDSIYAYKDDVLKLGYKKSNFDYPKYDELETFDYSSRVRQINENEIFILMNNSRKFAAIKVIKVDQKKLKFEYKIYEGAEIISENQG